MSEHGDETTRRQRRRTMPAAGPAFPLHSDDVLGEIFLRLGPLKPSLLRASHVCKQWRSLVSDPGFLRRFRARHRQPSLLGVFTQQLGKALFRSVLLDPPVIPSQRFSLQGHGSWDLLGCRHGRVLIMNHTEGKAIVYDPVTGDQHRIAVPWEFRQNEVVANINGAVLCTGTDDDARHMHGACRSSPFKIVLVGASTAYSAKRDLTYHMAHACVYSSKTRTWGKNVSALLPCDSYIPGHHSVFAGNALYWYLPGNILKFDMGMESLRVIRKLPVANDCYDTSHIIRSKGGGVGIALLSYPTFQVWDMKNFKRKNNCHGGTRWVPRKSISLELGYGSGIVQAILGFDEDENAIFFRVGSNIFIVHLVSMKSKKLWRSYTTCKYHPYTCYYTAALETSANNASMTYGGDQENTAQGGSVQI